MRAYRQRRADANNTDAVPAALQPGDAFETLFEEFELPKGMRVGFNSPVERSVEEEYHTYVRGGSAAKTSKDLLVFWQVGRDIL